MRLLSILLLFALAGVISSPLYAQGKPSDDLIYDQVRRKLTADRDVKGGAIEVEVKDGAVTLRGKVHEEKQKKKAERITRKVKGVTRVVNELVVEAYRPS